MDALEAIKTRRSVRTFLDRPVEREVLQQIIDCARLAPSSNNQQPWEFVVVTGGAVRSKIAELATYGKFIKNAPACVAVFCRPAGGYVEDGSAATENLILGAWALGVSSCWIAGHQTRYAEPIRALLKVPEEYKLVSLVALGYSEKRPNVRKRPLESVLHWEIFGKR